MTRRNLILIHRGPEYERDFKEISEKIYALNRQITIYSLSAGSTDQLPEAAWQRPTLTVALNSSFNLRVKRGPVLKSYQVNKLAQHRSFRKADIPTSPMQEFKFGMKLDPIMFGEFVIIKPMNLQLTSKGIGIQLFRRRKLEQLKPENFPQGHLIHKDRQGYLVQKFVDTGLYPSFYRVQTFLGKAIYSWHSTLVVPRCSLDESDEQIESTTIASQGGNKARKLISDGEVIKLAENVHKVFPDVPMLAVDIVKDVTTGRLFVLECNPGGNTWHFSSKIGEGLRLGFGNSEKNGTIEANALARRMFIDQFGAFDIVADVLTQKTIEFAG